MNRIEILDTTLRDGAQAEGISFSVEDKIKITKVLDSFGVDIIEVGYPAANPKDEEFCKKIADIGLKHARLSAFSSTVKYGTEPEDCPLIQRLVEANTPVVTIFGKSSKQLAAEIMGLTPEQNLSIIDKTVRYLSRLGKEVIFDAEHFFTAFGEDEEYALTVLGTAIDAGASIICLCDTKGDVSPLFAYEAVKKTVSRYPEARVGVHFHDDTGCAVASSLLAAEAGATHIQGTFLGIGERCGNADLSVVIPNLAFKSGYCFDSDMRELTKTAKKIAEICNVRIRNNKPYTGKSAFSHKAGMHIDGVKKTSSSFEHISPEEVGNRRRFLLSEIAGRNTLLDRVRRLVPEAGRDSRELALAVEALKEKEHYGYQYESAEASLLLLLSRTLGYYEPHFNVLLYKTTDDFPAANGELTSSAMICIEVDGKTEMSASLGNGPVNALDLALRRALTVFYPEVGDMHLVDFKVRVIDASTTTAAKVRVLIETTDGTDSWTTVGVSFDIIEACFTALIDSFEYKLMNLQKNT